MDIEDVFAVGGSQRVFRARYKIEKPGLCSHITQRAAGKEPLFLEDGDYLYFLMLLKESATKFNLEYFAFCLMPNHVHLLLEPREANLASAMHSIFSRYAAYFNRKYQRRGHLFGGRYRQALCLAPDYLLSASIYIHLNPVRAGLVQSAAAYRWSSAALYWDKLQKSFLNPNRIWELLDDDIDKARQKYARLVAGGYVYLPDNAQEQPGAIEKFCERLGSRFPSLFRRLQKKSASKDKDLKLPLAETPCLGQLISQFPSGSAKNPETKKAKKYVLEQLLARGFTRQEIAERLQISRKTIYNLSRS